MTYKDYCMPVWDEIQASGKLPVPDNPNYIPEKINWALANPELFAVWPLGLSIPRHQGYWLRLMKENPEILLLAPVDHGKMLALTTPLVTPTGWTTMGDVKVGDSLFSNEGTICHVTKVYQVEHKDSYAVKFDDGSEIIAGAEHLWLTWTLNDREVQWRIGAQSRGSEHSIPKSVGPTVKSTEEIRRTLKVSKFFNHSVPVTEPLQLPDVVLPITPYVLGCWLGDGTSVAPQIESADKELISFIQNEGYGIKQLKNSPKSKSRKYAFGFINTLFGTIMPGEMTKRLREINVLSNKHIPVIYLRSSETQRRSLLAGLMDTDGHAAKDGTVEFCNTNKILADNVYELVLSLGFKPHFYTGRATIKGIDKGPKYRICWTPRVHVFRLTRKKALLKPNRTQEFRTGHRRIIAVDKVPDVSMRCIAVDSQDHLYLAGKEMIATHNTTSAGLIYLLWEIARNLNTRIALIGYNDDILCGLLRNIQYAIENNDQLQLFGIRKDRDQKRWTEDLMYIDRPDKGVKDPTCIVLGRGSVIENRRIDIALMDDIVNWKDYVKGTKMHDKTCRWFLEQVIPRFRTTKIKVIGSPQAENDFYEWLKVGEFEGEKIGSDMRIVEFSSLVEKGKTFDIYDSDRDTDTTPDDVHVDVNSIWAGEQSYLDTLDALWPEEWPVGRLVTRLKRIGKQAACKKYLMIRMNNLGNMFIIKSIENCKSDLWTMPIMPDLIPQGMKIYFGFDPSSGDGASDGCLVVLGVKDGFHYIIDIMSGKYTLPQIKDLLYKNFLLWKPVMIKVENNSCQKWLQQDMADEIKYSIMPIEGHYTGVRKWAPMEGVPYIGALLDNKKLVIPFVKDHDKETVKDLLYELRVFPTGKKTDIVMALYLAETGILHSVEDFFPKSYPNPFSRRVTRQSQWAINKAKVLAQYGMVVPAR